MPPVLTTPAQTGVADKKYFYRLEPRIARPLSLLTALTRACADTSEEVCENFQDLLYTISAIHHLLLDVCISYYKRENLQFDLDTVLELVAYAQWSCEELVPNLPPAFGKAIAVGDKVDLTKAGETQSGTEDIAARGPLLTPTGYGTRLTQQAILAEFAFVNATVNKHVLEFSFSLSLGSIYSISSKSPIDLDLVWCQLETSRVCFHPLSPKSIRGLGIAFQQSLASCLTKMNYDLGGEEAVQFKARAGATVKQGIEAQQIISRYFMVAAAQAEWILRCLGDEQQVLKTALEAFLEKARANCERIPT